MNPVVLERSWIVQYWNNRQVLSRELEEWLYNHTGEKYEAASAIEEQRPAGHDWHCDNCRPVGKEYLPKNFIEKYDEIKWEDNHMAWCAYSASMLITPPEEFTGGHLQFFDPKTKEIT